MTVLLSDFIYQFTFYVDIFLFQFQFLFSFSLKINNKLIPLPFVTATKPKSTDTLVTFFPNFLHFTVFWIPLLKIIPNGNWIFIRLSLIFK